MASFCAGLPVALAPNHMVKGCPYKAGVLVRCVRLAPNTTVAQRAVTARMEPNQAEPTGMALRPRPRSRA